MPHSPTMALSILGTPITTSIHAVSTEYALLTTIVPSTSSIFNTISNVSYYICSLEPFPFSLTNIFVSL